MTDHDLKQLATACLAAAETWPIKWAPVISDGEEEFEYWTVEHTQGAATDEVAFGNDYDADLAQYIALLANSTPQLARGYLEAVEELEKRTAQRDQCMRLAEQNLRNKDVQIEALMLNVETGDMRLAGVLDDSFSVGNATAQKQIETLTADLATARAELSQFKEIVARELNYKMASVISDTPENRMRQDLFAAREALREACDYAAFLIRNRQVQVDHAHQRLTSILKRGGL